MISRRQFVYFATSLAITSTVGFGEDGSMFPNNLDHLIVGCSDLDAGIAMLEKSTGVKARFGGVHPGRGTRNALASFGDLHYLEIIAPDPAQTEVPPEQAEMPRELKALKAPQLVGWAVHTNNIEAVAKDLTARGVKNSGVQPGSRKRGDGRVLSWKTLGIDDSIGVLPFFIEWSKETTHPSVDAPAGLRLDIFAVAAPDQQLLRAELEKLGLKVSVGSAAKPELRSTISGPKGKLAIHS